MHDDFRPSKDATVVSRLVAAGAVLTGKLKLTEGAFAQHRTDVPVPVNPWHADYWPGTSSSGSAVATAAGMSFATIGTDTGGSICYPSAMNNLTGVKPTWGRVSRFGVFDNSPSLDHVGPMARSARDAALVLGVIAGADDDDLTSSTRSVPDYVADLGRPLAGTRIGVPQAYAREGVEADVLAAFDEALSVIAGFATLDTGVTAPDWRGPVRDWSTLSSVEMAVAHADRFDDNRALYGRALSEFIEQGRAVSGTTFSAAAQRRAVFAGRVERLFQEVDVIAVPAMSAARLTLSRMDAFDAEESRIDELLRFTAPFDMTGSPTVMFPIGATADGTPIAMQLLGRPFDEGLLLAIADRFQRETGWHLRRPPLAEV